MIKQQSLDELRVFNKFIEKYPYPIRKETIKKNEEPLPDILCFSKDGIRKYFELVECIDESLAKKVNVGIRFSSACFDEVSKLPEDQRQEFYFKYKNASIYVSFKSDIDGNKRLTAIPSLLKYLLSLENDCTGEKFLKEEKHLNRTISKVTLRRASFSGPLFDSNSGGSFGDPTLERISNKFQKNYKVDGSLELLAYYDMQPLLPEKCWLQKVQEYTEEHLDDSTFERVWVYSIHQNRVIFVYPS